MPCRNVYKVSRPEEKCPKVKEAGPLDQMGCWKERLGDGMHASRKSSQMRASEWNSLFFFSWMENDLGCRLLQRQKSLLSSKHWPVGFLFYFCQPIHRFQKCSIDLCSLPFNAQQTTLRGSAQKRITCILNLGRAWHRPLARASLVAQRLNRLPAMWETWVWSLGVEEPLEKEMATHSSIFAWRIPWTEEPEGLQSTGSQRVRHDWATSLSLWHKKGLSGGFPGGLVVERPSASTGNTVSIPDPRGSHLLWSN